MPDSPPAPVTAEDIAEIIRAFPFDDYGMDDVDIALHDDPETQEWVPALAAAVMALLADRWTPPPPGDRREQLPDRILALVDVPAYTSTACELADLLAAAAAAHPEHAGELHEWAARLRARCRANNKYTGALCASPNHPEAAGE
ncbi:hypothetical protein [Streptomyces synnematoformans]|uniref:Uncharacterized protein n=1 Tax=Streptomyces synnematoformans TaxID=415721 RepID=A0ABN2XD66_9ACTN